MDFDNLQEILFTIGKNKLRTFLTAFGVFWGILMLILLLGAGKGLENGTNSNFGSDDRTSIWINARSTAMPYKGIPQGRRIEFVEEDIEAIKREIEGVEYISAENQAGERWRRTVNVTYQNKSANFSVLGVANDYFNIKKYLEYREGRTLNKLDNQENRKVAIIGTAVQEALFGKENAVGKSIQFHGIVLKVVGVFYDSGREGRMSERVYVPLTTFQKTFGRGQTVGQITVTPIAARDSYKFEDDIVALLKQRHLIHPKDSRAIFAFNFARQTEQISQTFRAIGAFVWFVGLGTLAAGIVGISNIMIITVKDRTREIGVRKALGATPNAITWMILSESVLITSIAGYMGLVMGVALIELANIVLQGAGASSSFFQRPEVDLNVAFTAIVILVVAGTFAGLAPALRAAKIQPIEAMRE